MRFEYKTSPLPRPHPAFPKEKGFHWVPVLKIRISNPKTHSPPTKFFEAVVDSGSDACYFHSDLAKAIGIKVAKGTKSEIGGVKKGLIIPVYFHTITLYLGVEMIPIKAGFSDELSVAGLLGRRGFFENYIVTFDPCATPPGMEITRIHRV